MRQKPITINARNLFGDYSKPTDYQNCENGHSSHFQWPREIGSGFMSMTKLQPGLLLGVADYRLDKNIVVEFDHDASSIVLSFSVLGSSPPFPITPDASPWSCCPRTDCGYEAMSFLRGGRGLFSPLAGSRVNYVGMALDPSLVHSLFSDHDPLIPAEILKMIVNHTTESFYRIAPIRPAVALIIRQILNCPYSAPLKRLYLECKALELIIHCLGPTLISREPGKSAPLRPTDMDRVCYARELIEQSYQTPPRLLDLAKTVGMPHPKLNDCFRQVYGTTIFNYLREFRLQKARTFLDGGHMNVTDVAYEVGYSSLSHFTKAFKKHVGITPRDYLRNPF